MRWLIRVVVGLVVLLAVLAAAGLVFLPRNVVVSRSVIIDAPAAIIWPYVSDLRRANDWSAWAKLDPDGTRYVYEGPETGVGQTLSWSSEHPNVGTGTQRVVAIDPGRSVETSLDFGDMGTADANLTLTPNNGSTEVTWGFRTDLGMNPITRWFGLFFDRWVGNDYEAGLANLKTLAEKQASQGG